MSAIIDLIEYAGLALAVGAALVLAGAGWFLWAVSRSKSAK